MTLAAAEGDRRRGHTTLVLNRDYTPLSTWPPSIITVHEAIHGMVRERMDLVEAWPGEVFRSPRVTFPAPKVVKTREFIDIYAKPKFCRRSVLLRDRYRCAYCGERFDSSELTFDHVTPRALGGKTEWTNISMACIPCNAAKGDKPPVGKWAPRKWPRQPSTVELLAAGLELLPQHVIEDFRSWLYWESVLDP